MFPPRLLKSLYGSRSARPRIDFIRCAAWVWIPMLLLSCSQHSPEWTGQGQYRLLVSVPPFVLDSGRSRDEMPARYQVDFVKLLEENHLSGKVDLSSLQVHRYDPASGKAMPFPGFHGANSYDRPCRFDDQVAPLDYPSRIGYSSDYPDGRPPVKITRGKARLFDREKQAGAGAVIWTHTQENDQPAYYAIYFEIKSDSTATRPSPAPWIGDVDVLRKDTGMRLASLPHFTSAIGDLNGDGLFDLVASAEKGDVMWYPNRGSLGHPRFDGCIMVTDEEGPVDAGWYGAPFLFDWNNDGLVDLLIGTSHNVILWWKNTGSRTDPAFRYMGFVQSDGQRLEVPQRPVPEDPKNIFAKDYYNQPWIGDWNADGIPDILTGGYTTGLIFYYRGTGRDSSGVPILAYDGPLRADGQPIDATWAASPTAYDFDGDGRLELLTGSWWWSGIPYSPKPGQADFLMYYVNMGTPSSPQLTRRPIPGKLEGPGISRANVVDWNNDGLPDLFADGSVYFNEGTPKAPRWTTKGQRVNIPWGVYSAPGLVSQRVRAWSKGQKDIRMDGSGQFYAVGGTAYAPEQMDLGGATVDGKPIDHPGPGYGDGYRFTAMVDWDQDSLPDLLWGTQQGNIYLHRNLGKEGAFAFAPGVKLQLTTGEDLKVGPPVVASAAAATNFTVLQGSRIRFFGGDIDGDGILDLAVTDTYGDVWVFLNTRQGGVNTLAPGVKVAKFKKFMWSFNPIEWNGDGKTDIIAEGNTFEPGQLLVNTSTPGYPSFSEPARPKELRDLPFVFWGPGFHGQDWNGDGDEDILIQSELHFFFWAERTFLTHGYGEAVAVQAMEKKG